MPAALAWRRSPRVAWPVPPALPEHHWLAGWTPRGGWELAPRVGRRWPERAAASWAAPVADWPWWGPPAGRRLGEAPRRWGLPA